MVKVPSTMAALGTPAPDFTLPNPATGKTAFRTRFTMGSSLEMARHTDSHFRRAAFVPQAIEDRNMWECYVTKASWLNLSRTQ